MPRQNEPFREMAEAMRNLTAMAEEIGRLAQQSHFILLDALPDDLAREPRSWEVEREDFVRRLEARDAD